MPNQVVYACFYVTRQTQTQTNEHFSCIPVLQCLESQLHSSSSWFSNPCDHNCVNSMGNNISAKVVSDSQLIRTEPIPDLGAGNRISRTWGIGLVEFLHETFQMNQIWAKSINIWLRYDQNPHFIKHCLNVCHFKVDLSIHIQAEHAKMTI